MSTPYQPTGGASAVTSSGGASSYGGASGMSGGASAVHASGHASGSTDVDDIRNVSVGQLLSDVSRDFSTLMRQEVALAKAEAKAEASKAVKGAGMLGAAGYAGHFVILFLSLAAWWALQGATHHTGLSALIVAIVWAAIAGALFVVGRGRLKAVNPKPERTVNTVKEVPDALKGH